MPGTKLESLQGFRVSPQQRRLWSLQQKLNGVAFHVKGKLLIEGPLNTERLDESIQKCIIRHESLRTTFCGHSELVLPVQVVMHSLELPLDIRDSQDGSCSQDRQHELPMDSGVQPNFNYIRGPLLWAQLVRVSPVRHVLSVVVSSLCTDQAGLSNLFRDVVRNYEGTMIDGSAEAVAQYPDVAEWLNQLIEDETSLGREYWRKQHFVFGSKLEVISRSENVSNSFIPHSLHRTMRLELCRAFSVHGSSIFPLLLTCWLLYLSRAGLTTSAIAAVGFECRRFPILKNAVGLLARYLPMSLDVKSYCRFVDAQATVENSLKELSKWQECFEWEERWGEGYFPYCFDYEEWPEVWECGTTRFRVLEQYACIDRFRLRLNWVRQGERWRAAWDWDPSYYTKEDVERLAEGYEALLEQALEQPETMVGALEAVGAREKRRVTEAFNETAVEFGEPQSLSERFERQVGRTPKEIAVSDERRSYSYEELNRRANRVRNYLWKQGMGPESLVGICMERSADLMAALLGVLKAGAAYVPLDPGYPAERLRFMLSDAGVELVLTERVMAGALPIEYAGRRVNVEEIWEASDESAEQNQVSGAGPENAAYVIYTSGSTGQPKGVVISQAAICNHMDWIGRRAVLSAQDRVLQKTPYNFDASVWEFYAPLEAGAQLVMARPGGHQDAQYLVEIMARERITVVQMVPSQLRMVLEEPGFERCRWLRRVYCGGEALERSLVERFQERTGAELENLYGPTEATIDAVSWVCGRDEQGVVPIGTPIANVQAYVLDQELQTVPVGVSGELYLGGVGLARGYLKRPQLTAERFLPNPWNANGGRLYRTGDVARWRSDGVLEYVGRSDSQVKLRGYRIELGEIESLLRGHEAVSEAIAVVREENPGNALLLAYVVGKERVVLDKAELLVYLRQQLPDYMVPSILMVLDRLPLTPHGKIDRKALPTPERSGNNTIPQRPRTPVEDVLVNIWEDVLGLPDLGLQENFFDLGGHSLLATQVISRVREAFHVEVPLATLFEYPTVTALGTQIERSLRAGQLSEVPPLRSAPRDHPLPLSFAQQRLWFLDQFTPGSTVYNMPSATRLRGRLDVRSLAASLNTIVQRHEVLRTSFPAGPDGQPFQAIAPSLELPLNLIDLSALPEQKREEECLHYARKEEQQLFDLAHGPLLRFTLLQIDEQEHVLLFTMHHIISDGWSLSVLVRELSELYESHLRAVPPQLSPLPIQYADYALWQREWLDGEVLDRQIAYWRDLLSDAPPLLTLPTDFARPRIPHFQGTPLEFKLSDDIAEQLRALSRREGVTMFMVLLAAYAVLLHRYSGQSRIVIGVPMAGRSPLEVEPLIGLFINTLPLCIDMSGNPTFQQLLRRVRQLVLEAYTHQHVPFEKLVEELQPERDISRHSPLFQVMFVHEGKVQESAHIQQLEACALKTGSFGAKFDLRLGILDDKRGLEGSLVYDAHLFQSETAQRMLQNFQFLLESVIHESESVLSELPIIADVEQESMLTKWNGPDVTYSRDMCLHSLFEEQAKRSPAAVALVHGDRAWTYRQLNERANHLAHHLRALGIKRGNMVCVCVSRGLEMIAALLGILKADAVYIPIDPSYPPARIASILSNVDVGHIVTKRDYVGKLTNLDPGSRLRHMICLDDHDSAAKQSHRDVIPTEMWTWQQLSSLSSNNPLSQSGPGDLAYVIFTSGSTGEPKGVMMQHQPVVNMIEWVNRTYGIGPNDRVLQVSSLCFDLSVYDIFGVLSAGGSIQIADETARHEPRELYKLLMKEPVTLWNSAPATFQQLVPLLSGSNGEAQSSRLRLVFLSGDWIPVTFPDIITSSFPEARIVALGGATEAAVWSNSFDVRAVDPGWASIPYGRPIYNSKYYVLGSTLHPCPIGVTGDLYIGGDCLSLGYVAQPGLTACRFVPDPFSKFPGSRLYSTGDRARWKSEGNLEFMGRIDQQVKIRGFRVELGEIESILQRHESVGEAVVVMREDTPGDQRLVAYVTSAADRRPEAGELIEYAKERLPVYMVPALVVVLEKLPLTANGKIDRKALPAVEWGGAIDEGANARTPVEEVLAGIWARTLGLEEVGIYDNFFDLGGHSLLATQVMSRVREAFGVDLPLRALFEASTVAGLGLHIENLLHIGVQTSMPPLHKVGREQPLPLSFAQQRLWFLYQMAPGNAAYNLPEAVHLQGALDAIALEESLNDLIARHEILRTTFPLSEDGEPVQSIAPKLRVRLESVDVSSLPTAERQSGWQRQARAEEETAFDLAHGPLVRARLVRLDEQQHILLFTTHHIVSDGWSTGIMIRELSALYEARRAGKEALLPILAIQYADYAVWQRNWLQGEVLEEQLQYWSQQLANAPARLELPTDFARPAAPSFRGAQQKLELSPELSMQIVNLSRREGVTLFMTLLTTYQIVLGALSGQSEVIVGTDIANRNRLETEGLIGFFANQLVLRGELGGNPTFRELLRRARDATLGAYAHQDLPFDKLVEELRPERKLNYSPLVQAKLVLQNAPPGEFRVPGLQFQPLQLERPISKFDLLMTVWGGAKGLHAVMLYATDLFAPATITGIGASFEAVLRQAVANADVDFTSCCQTIQMLKQEQLRSGQRKFKDLSAASLARKKASYYGRQHV